MFKKLTFRSLLTYSSSGMIRVVCSCRLCDNEKVSFFPTPCESFKVPSQELLVLSLGNAALCRAVFVPSLSEDAAMGESKSIFLYQHHH